MKSQVPRRLWKVLRLLPILLAVTTASCGEKKDPEEEADDKAKNNRVLPAGGTGPGGSNGRTIDSSSTLLFDVDTPKYNESVDLTVHRFRAWRSNPSNYAPNQIDDIDKAVVELWFSYGDNTDIGYDGLPLEEAEDNEDADPTPVYRYEVRQKLNTDGEGWVFLRDEPAGKLKKYDTGAVNTDSFKVSAPDGLLSDNYPLQTYDAMSDEDDYPWSDLKLKDVASGFELATETQYKVNKKNDGSFAKTFKMGCKINDDNYIYKDVEVGNQTYYPTTEDEDSPQGNNEITIAWSTQWRISGINLSTQKLRLFRYRTAPLWTRRELPNTAANSDTTHPGASGLEKLIRKCNKKAESGGQFELIWLQADGSDEFAVNEYRNNADVVDYCDTYATNVSDDPNAVSLNSFPGGCNANWSNDLGGKLTFVDFGRWNGTDNSANIDYGSGTDQPLAVEQTDPVVFDFAKK